MTVHCQKTGVWDPRAAVHARAFHAELVEFAETSRGRPVSRDVLMNLEPEIMGMVKGPELHITSAIALVHLPHYIYMEADKDSHVREVCKGLNNVYAQNITLVPIKEMTDILSVERKTIVIARDNWVRLKIGIYKGVLASQMPAFFGAYSSDQMRHIFEIPLLTPDYETAYFLYLSRSTTTELIALGFS